jgi:hypothetical protein
MLKRKFIKFVVFPFIGINMVFAAAAMPSWIGDRIVDGVMNWGDRHIGGPFKKGGGDETATRQVVSDLVMPVKAWRAVLDVTLGSESKTATAEQDTPGWSPQGVRLPVTHGQAAVDSQPTLDGLPVPSNQVPTAKQPLLVPIPTTTQVSSTPERTHDTPVGPSDHVTGSATRVTNDAPGGKANSEGTTPQTPTKTIELRAGEDTWAQATKEPKVNLNPELATGGNPTPTASSPAAPSSPPPSAPATNPQPAPSPAPQHGGGPDRGGPMHGAERIDGGGRAPGGTPPDRGAIDAHSGIS